LEASLILCRFDPIYGPKIFLKAPKSLNEEEIKKIPTLMEIRPDGFFIHIFENLKTANLFFKIPSAYARGGKEGFLISIVSNINSELKLMWAKELLESFAQNLTNLEEVYKAFDYDTKNYIGDKGKLSEIENLFFSFYNSIVPAIKTLEIAEQRYQALFKTARDAIFIINKDAGIIIDVNLEAEKIVESSRDEILGLKPSQLQIKIPEMLESNFSIYLNSHTETPLLSQLKKSNGKIVYMEVNVNEIQLGDQNLVQFVLHDITERINSERMIEEHAKNIAILNKIIIVTNQAKNLSELMSNVLDYIMGFLNFDGCCIYLINEITRTAKIEAYKGLILSFINKNALLTVDHAIYNIVFVKGIAIFSEMYPEIEKKLLERTKFATFAIIPLFSSIKIIGAICVLLENYKMFTKEERELFDLIGLQLGTAIDKLKKEVI
jgi:PAS domain S-box-containing protein